MEGRYITEQQFDLILSKLVGVVCQVNAIDTSIGFHAQYGATTLVRDGSRRMALIDNPAPLDRFLAEQAFLTGGRSARVAGRG